MDWKSETLVGLLEAGLKVSVVVWRADMAKMSTHEGRK